MGETLDFDTATSFVRRLPYDTRMKIAGLLLRELASHNAESHPLSVQAMDEEADQLREGLYACIRDAAKEKAADELALMAAWFVERAEKPILIRWLWYIEHNQGDGDEVESPAANTPSNVRFLSVAGADAAPVVDNPVDSLLREEHDLMKRALVAIRSAVHDDGEEGDYHSVREMLDDLDIFHDDLSGQRVVRELAIAVLKKVCEEVKE